MGGFGSTRWGWQTTRQDTDPLLKLDVRVLHRQGALRPGAAVMQHWICRGAPAGSILTIRERDRPVLMLDYRTRAPGGNWQPVRERVPLVTTPCHYGGARVWFACPGCHSRRAVLFSVCGRFRCRSCHDLAYSSTRASAGDRAARRREAAQKKLGGEPTAMHAVPPAKPKGMHWRTYERLVARLKDAWQREQGERHAEMLALVARLDKQLGTYQDTADSE